jgi:hypothetical protein
LGHQECNLRQGKVVIALAAIFTIIGSVILGFAIGIRQTEKVIAVNLIETPLVFEEVSPEYPFLPKDLSLYIEDLCTQLGIDTNLAVAILLQENPEIKVDATNRNQNGTSDLGLWQLNDRYLYTDFEQNYWKMEVELNPFNWKHNTFIALNHIHWLQSRLKVQDDVIMAYNCGIGAVMNGNIPDITKVYLRRVKNNYNLLKGQADGRYEQTNNNS